MNDAEHSHDAQAHNGNSLLVLVVDDSPQVRQGLVTVLNLAGCRTEPKITIAGEARSGADAICHVQKLQPDVVILDLEMPDLDGYNATRAIKFVHPATRIIALSIHSDTQVRFEAEQVGVDAFILKGAPLEELIQAILSTSKNVT